MGNGDNQANELQTIILRSLGLGIQIAVVVVAAVLGSLFLGLWIDRKLGTTPWATLLSLGLGTLVAVVGFYRTIAPVVVDVAAGQEVEWGESLRSLVLVVQVGLVVLTPPLVGLFLGLWMDRGLDTRPWVTMTLTVLGTVAGLVGAWRLSSTFLKRTTKGDEEETL